MMNFLSNDPTPWTTIATIAALLVAAAAGYDAVRAAIPPRSRPAEQLRRTAEPTVVLSGLLLFAVALTVLAVHRGGFSLPVVIASGALAGAMTVAALVERRRRRARASGDRSAAEPRLVPLGIVTGAGLVAGVFVAIPGSPELAPYFGVESELVLVVRLALQVAFALVIARLWQPRRAGYLVLGGIAVAFVWGWWLLDLVGLGGSESFVALFFTVIGTLGFVPYVVAVSVTERQRRARRAGGLLGAASVVLFIGMLCTVWLSEIVGAEAVIWGSVVALFVSAPLLELGSLRLPPPRARN